MLVEFCGQSVDFLVGPVVEQLGLGQLREGCFHRSGLFDGALFDALALVFREAGESLLEGLDVEDGDGKGADAATGAAELAGHFPQQSGGGPLEPAISLLIEGGRVWLRCTCHGRSFHFDGEVDDEIALGGVEALVINLDDPVTLFLVELQDPSVEVVTLVGHVVEGEPGREHKARALDIFAHKLCFDIVVSGEEVEKLRFFFLEHVLIGASITDAEYLNRLSVTIVSERDLDPGPFVQHGVVHVRRGNRRLATGLEELQEQTERGGVFFLAKHSRIEEFLCWRGLGRLGGRGQNR